MASLATSHTPYPPNIEALLNSLETSQNNVSYLEEKLSLARQECHRLEKEFAEYQASIAPIHTCPPEVLSEVFNFYLLENPRIIRRLLLVCRQWYNVAVNDPRLWNRIFISIGDEWDVRGVAASIQRRVKLCLERSGTLPLEIDLALHGLCYIDNHLVRKAKDILANDGLVELFQRFLDWAWDDVDLEEEHPEIVETYSAHNFDSIIREIVGEQGEILLRWGSFHLSPPERTELIYIIWDQLGGPTPNLKCLNIRLGDARNETGKRPMPFSNLSALTYLDLYGIDTHNFEQLNHSTIEHFVIHKDVTYWNPQQLSRLTHLRCLEVHLWECNPLEPRQLLPERLKSNYLN